MLRVVLAHTRTQLNCVALKEAIKTHYNLLSAHVRQLGYQSTRTAAKSDGKPFLNTGMALKGFDIKNKTPG